MATGVPLRADDKPLLIKDQENYDLKYTILARDGYAAKHEVE